MTRCWTITFSTKTAVVKIKEIIDLPIERRYRISCRREESPCDGQTNCRVLAFIFDLGERISAGPPGAVVQWAGGVVGPSSCPRTRNRLIIERCGFHSSFNQFGYFVYGERTDFRSTVFICHVTWSDFSQGLFLIRENYLSAQQQRTRLDFGTKCAPNDGRLVLVSFLFITQNETQ